MDIEVKRMSPTAIEMLDQLSAVCKRFGVDYYAASQNQRDLLDSIALHEYQLKKAHEQGLKRSEVPPFLGLKRSDRSNDMPCLKVRLLLTMLHYIPRPFGLGIFCCHSPARNSKPRISLYRGCSFLGGCGILGLAQQIGIGRLESCGMN